MIKNLFIVFIIFFSTQQYAYSYIDPGTGSIILQAIIGAIATCMVFFNNIKIKIKKIFKSKKKKKKKIEGTPCSLKHLEKKLLIYQ